MTAHLTGGKSHGKEIGIKDAFANIAARPNQEESFAMRNQNPDDVSPEEIYELVAIGVRGIAFYRFRS